MKNKIISLFLYFIYFIISLNFKNVSSNENLKQYSLIENNLNKNKYLTLSSLLSRYLIITPSLSWGYQLAIRKKINIAIVGGSNSQSAGSSNYPSLLRKYIPKYSDSYILNLATGSAIGDIHFFVNCVGSNEELIQKFNNHDPPNLWMIDFSINIGDSDIDQIELLLFTIWNLYDLRNFTRPSILFIDLFSPRSFYMPKSRGNGQHFYIPTTGAEISRIARFYDIPFLSFTDYLFHEFIKDYRMNCLDYDMHDDKCVSPLFIGGNDRHHLSELAHKLCVNNLIIPLLEIAMSMDTSSPYLPNILPYTYKLIQPHISIYNTCRLHRMSSYPSLRYQSISFKTTEYMSNRFCLGTNQANSMIEIPLQTVNENINPKSIGIMSLKSWNISYVGLFQCRFDNENSDWYDIHPKASIMATRIEPTILHNQYNKRIRSKSIICRTSTNSFVCISGIIVQY